MKTNKTLLIIPFLLIIMVLGGCIEEKMLPIQNISCDCLKEKGLIQTLKNEPAHVGYSDLMQNYTFELTTGANLNPAFLIIPCDNIPDKYKVVGLSVLISGDVTFCSERNDSTFRIIPYYNFKLSTIKVQ